jgi:hypothetical protein
LAWKDGAKASTELELPVRPKLARSCWFDAMMGKSRKKIGTETGRVSITRKSIFG